MSGPTLESCFAESGGGPGNVSTDSRTEEEPPSIVHGTSDLIPSRYQSSAEEGPAQAETPRRESQDVVDDLDLVLTHTGLSVKPRQSSSTYRTSSPPSRPHSPFSNPSRLSLPSTATSASLFGLNQYVERNNAEPTRRPSILTRLRSSISTLSGISTIQRSPSIQFSEFRRAPENPEKHFIDSIGMVIPGVCNRTQCSQPVSHFVTNWRLCEPLEYTTVLADHGITYTDYCRLVSALTDFLDEIPQEPRSPKPKPETESQWWNPRAWGDIHGVDEGTILLKSRGSRKRNARRNAVEPLESVKKTEKEATDLNNLLADITVNWRARSLPVMVCIGSFSLFAPNRIAGAHVQILHVPFESSVATSVTAGFDHKPGQRLSFVDPFSGLIKTHELDDSCVALPRHRVSRSSVSPPSPPSPVNGSVLHRHQLHLRDRTRPWPLWPNAIPSTKRSLMEGHVDRYGTDPYFRAYLRANVNSRTRTTSYAKYMIEREDNPFINKRLDYVHSPSNSAMLWALLTKGYKDFQAQNPKVVNRDHYEHNRRLECRKTVEQGSRLRIVRFGFRHPIYPPHTPEMNELGLSRDKYEDIVAEIEDIRLNDNLTDCGPRLIPGFAFQLMRRRGPGEAVTKVSEYIRNLNAQQKHIVWTIEKIPGVYDTYLGSRGKEWEISAWNGEDALELLLQLEKWGIIEKRLDIDDDD